MPGSCSPKTSSPAWKRSRLYAFKPSLRGLPSRIQAASSAPTAGALFNTGPARAVGGVAQARKASAQEVRRRSREVGVGLWVPHVGVFEVGEALPETDEGCAFGGGPGVAPEHGVYDRQVRR